MLYVCLSIFICRVKDLGSLQSRKLQLIDLEIFIEGFMDMVCEVKIHQIGFEYFRIVLIRI